VEIALSQHCGPQDVLTPIMSRDEKTRRELGYAGAQNYVAPLAEYRARDWGRLLLRGRRKSLKNHSPAALVRAFVGEQVWNEYYKFCFERNPWDRLVSLYHWRIRRLSFTPEFEEFAYAAISPERERQKQYKAGGFFNWPMYTIDGSLAVDHVARYEELEDELRSISHDLSLPWSGPLTKAKSGHRNDSRDYRDYYDDTLREAVREACAWEIEQLGYQF